MNRELPLEEETAAGTLGEPDPPGSSVRFRRSPSALFREVGPEVLLAAVGRPGFDVLSGPATAVWALLDRPQTLEELVASLEDRYDAPRASIETDVQRLLAELTRRGWIEEVSPGVG